MKVLLDTHIIVWLATEPDRIPQNLRSKIETAASRFFSSVSAVEIELKHRRYPSKFPFDGGHLQKAITDLSCTELALKFQHAAELRGIPLLHNDPFDHLLMAQAMSERIALATMDKSILGYQLKHLQFL